MKLLKLDREKVYKIKTPEKGNDIELDNFYNYVFDILGVSWAGRCGHYPYDSEYIADNQDGFLYIWWGLSKFIMSADSSFHSKNIDVILLTAL